MMSFEPIANKVTVSTNTLCSLAYYTTHKFGTLLLKLVYQPTKQYPVSAPTEYPTSGPTEYPVSGPTEYPTSEPTEYPTQLYFIVTLLHWTLLVLDLPQALIGVPMPVSALKL